MPLISVLFPVRNGEKFVESAIQSVLNQTFRDFELLVLDDASTDKTVEIVTRINDRRIRIFRSATPLGLARNLNRGILGTTAPWIARMDADDLCDPERFQKQLDFMAANPSFAVCSTNIREINEKGEVTLSARWPRPSVPICPFEWQLVFETPLAHPSVLLNRSLLEKSGGVYREVFAEDHDLWCRLSVHGRIHRLPETLFSYRIHEKSLYVRTRQECMAQTVRSSNKFLNAITKHPKFSALIALSEASVHGENPPPLLSPKIYLALIEDAVTLFSTRFSWSEIETARAKTYAHRRLAYTYFKRRAWFKTTKLAARKPTSVPKMLLERMRARYLQK